MLVEKLCDDGSRPGVPDVCCRVKCVDDHAVAEGGCVGNNDGVNVPDGTVTDTPEDLGGGIGLDVTGDSHKDQACGLRTEVSDVIILGKLRWYRVVETRYYGLTQRAEKMG